MVREDSENKEKWSSVTSMQQARSHPSVVQYGGRIYVIGGGGPGFESLKGVEIFDPKKKLWSKGRDMPTARSGMATFVINNKIYVVGGGFKQPNGRFKFLTLVEIYDPETDQWSQGSEMLQPHDYPAYALLDGQMYILGGHHPDATAGGPQTDPGFHFCERYDFSKGSWSELAPLPKPRFAATAISMKGKIFAFGGVAFTGGGMTEYGHVEVFDPLKGVWEIAPWKMPWSAAAHGTCIRDKELYIFGGFNGDSGIGVKAATFDLRNNHWETISPLPEPRAAMGVAVWDRSIFLVGGWASDRSVMSSVIYYTPE